MRDMLFGIAFLLVYTISTVFQQDYNLNQRQLEKVKFVCEEASASASLYHSKTEYAEGREVFDQAEGKKALEDQIKTLLYLDSSFIPTASSYWRDKANYKVYFFDDSNTTYPYVFVDPDTGYTRTITDPTVVVTINTGRPRYRLSFITLTDTIRSSSHEWISR